MNGRVIGLLADEASGLVSGRLVFDAVDPPAPCLDELGFELARDHAKRVPRRGDSSVTVELCIWDFCVFENEWWEPRSYLDSLLPRSCLAEHVHGS